MATLLPPPPEDFLRRRRFLAMGLPECLLRECCSLLPGMELVIRRDAMPSSNVERCHALMLKEGGSTSQASSYAVPCSMETTRLAWEPGRQSPG